MKVLIYILLIVLVTSCNKTIDIKDKTLYSDLDHAPSIPTEKLFSKIEIISLETNEQSLIQKISKVIEYNSRLYILDSRQKAILIFDKAGKFISKIHTVGRAPSEYSLLYDIAINTYSETLEALDPMGKIITYDLKGNYISSIHLPHPPMAYHHISILNKDSILLHTEPRITTDYTFRIFSRKVNSITKQFNNQQESIAWLMKGVLQVYKDTLYYSQAIHHEVYKIIRDSLHHAYSWNFGKYSYDINKMQLPNLTDPTEEMKFYKEVMYSSKIPYTFRFSGQNDQYYYCSIFMKEKMVHVFQDKMSKKDIDWSNIGFGYMPTEASFVSNYKDGAWDEGVLTADDKVVISECAGVLQYAQTCFEGLKAYRTKDGKVVCFRPDLNASRMADSCKRLEMPVYPEDKWVEAIEKVVKANIDYVPPYGSGATLYIRPYMFGSNPVIGVKPANEYQFRVFVTPVGPYFKGGVKPITIRVSDFDRAAPHGTGHIKAGLNYAMSLHAIVDAHNQGFDENMYLDAATRTKVEETGGANFIFVTKDNKIVTPKSNSILPSITRRSLMYVAKEYLGLEVEEREVYFDEVKDFTECGLCGTAAVISPVGKINDHGKEICFPSGMDEIGPVLKKLYETLTGIQMGTIEAPEGWIKVIEE